MRVDGLFFVSNETARRIINGFNLTVSSFTYTENESAPAIDFRRYDYRVVAELKARKTQF